MKSKIIENKKEKEKKILSASFDLFTQKDIHQVSVSEIARKAGVAKGTIYLYFKDKYQIRDVLISQESVRIFSDAQKKLEENDIRSLEDSLVFLINQILITLENNPVRLRFIEKNLSLGVFSSHLHSAIDDNTMNIKNIFREKAKENNYQYQDPDTVLYMIVELVGSTCYNSILYNNPLPIQEYKPYLFEAIRSILKGLRINKEFAK
ncbi:TetR/AcrR family transcriptional regulator [Catenisphaera adipataccumulans]|jgi:AcrR family transcriptional regulator|uniref:AcrR family transcriptional regulator n=1 Tax=Catenisphaera adipataccumulans TaxID=700500 RepID=A0A7W8FWL3_9FIRM|nr:TetR/AcrR family transcriptional regulator [Catenisphaera adipataccumulans]MBB5182047.1 AcrR family transcriptional regulator [Catenisphaera adipataccumulans]